jgi:hypothetical protein
MTISSPLAPTTFELNTAGDVENYADYGFVRKVNGKGEINRAADDKQRLHPWCKLQKLINYMHKISHSPPAELLVVGESKNLSLIRLHMSLACA